MSILVAAGVGSVLLAGGISAAHGAHATREVAFQASLRGKLDILVRPSGLQIVGWAQGTATLLGNTVLLATGPTEQPRAGCWQFSGVGSLIGGNGDRLFLALGQPRVGCRVRPGSTTFPSSAQVQVIGGTGPYARAAGQLKMTSSGDAISSGITLKISGTVTY
ncbi:MAG TPA: hypothetical protein VJT84_04105 [Gaiellaceae bacterium]|nr:hypothetical protein [Gaiellaceae bacterium]